MNFETSRAKAIDKLNQFVEKNLSDYSKLRNFDFGPYKRDNVSCLSPYVTHGVLNEIEIIKKSLEKFSFSKNEKFIQEVLWRTYWKGWLELRPNVWSDYLIDLRNIKEKYKDDKNYQNAIEGKTNIDCFNEWVNELKNITTSTITLECGLPVFGFLHLIYLGNLVLNFLCNTFLMEMPHQILLDGDGLQEFKRKESII